MGTKRVAVEGPDWHDVFATQRTIFRDKGVRVAVTFAPTGGGSDGSGIVATVKLHDYTGKRVPGWPTQAVDWPSSLHKTVTAAIYEVLVRVYDALPDNQTRTLEDYVAGH